MTSLRITFLLKYFFQILLHIFKNCPKTWINMSGNKFVCIHHLVSLGNQSYRIQCLTLKKSTPIVINCNINRHVEIATKKRSQWRMPFRSTASLQGTSVVLLLNYLWLIPLVSNRFSSHFQTTKVLQRGHKFLMHLGHQLWAYRMCRRWGREGRRNIPKWKRHNLSI